jgi:DNA polymerase III delta prime subunit
MSEVLVIGHEEALSNLKTWLPPVSLFLGPPSVGKRRIARHLARYYKIAIFDCREIHRLTAEVARNLQQFIITTPSSSPFKLVTITLSSEEYSASTEALNILLKVLEEPPPFAKFILVADRDPIPTIMSRAQVFRLGYLSNKELCEVLTRVIGIEEKSAQAWTERAGGSVAPTLAVPDLEIPRAKVVAILQALAERDVRLLDFALLDWSVQAQQLLLVWAKEATTRRWKTFSEAESFGLQETRFPAAMLFRLSTAARPRLATRAALAALISEGT